MTRLPVGRQEWAVLRQLWFDGRIHAKGRSRLPDGSQGLACRLRCVAAVLKTERPEEAPVFSITAATSLPPLKTIHGWQAEQVAARRRRPAPLGVRLTQWGFALIVIIMEKYLL
ncbi:MAG: hypothetical protein R6V32_11290 [Bacteroidales bacterium]